VWASPIHLLIIVIVVLVLFGGNKIKPRKPPTHPLPVTSPLENSRTSAVWKEELWHQVTGLLRPKRKI
jgi:hypothetical protein